MTENYSIAKETDGYVTVDDPSNTDFRYLVAGSKNCLIDQTKKVKIRSGYTRIGAAAADGNLFNNRNAWTWHTSTGVELAQRFNEDRLEVYLSTVEGIVVNAWTLIAENWSTTKKLRHATWYDPTEKIDLQIMCQGDENLYEYNGAVAVIKELNLMSVTKEGTDTFAQRRFYTTRNKTFVNTRTGVEYTYTAGESSTTLTGIADTTGLQVGDVIVQKIVTKSNTPSASHKNDIIFGFENQIVTGSYTDELAYLSKNSDYTAYTFSTPRLAGEGALFTLTDPTRAINKLGKLLLIFSGYSTIFKISFTPLSIGAVEAETVKVENLNVGVRQGALNQESIIPVGDMLAYLTNEVALRTITDPNNLTGIDPKTLSNPIKPDFDAETWDPENTFGEWYKNTLIYTAGASSRMYMLNFVEDADGKLFRFWNPPQVLPVGPMSIFDAGDGPLLYGHSNSIPESYLLFDGLSDGQYPDIDASDKIPIDLAMAFAYNNYKKPELLKTFDEYYFEGEITENTTNVSVTINLDYQGSTLQISRTIDGSDEDLLEGLVGYSSLAQSSLGIDPLGGLLNPPSDARRFRVIFEIAKEDFHQEQVIITCNEVDQYIAITAKGANVKLSPRKPINIHK